jgi:hypothetical protein
VGGERQWELPVWALSEVRYNPQRSYNLDAEVTMSDAIRKVEEFLAQKHLAVAGVSRKPEGKAANAIYKKLKHADYQVSAATSCDNWRKFARGFGANTAAWCRGRVVGEMVTKVLRDSRCGEDG